MTNRECAILMKHIEGLDQVLRGTVTQITADTTRARYSLYPDYGEYTLSVKRDPINHNALNIIIDTPENPNNRIKVTVQPGLTLIETLADCMKSADMILGWNNPLVF